MIDAYPYQSHMIKRAYSSRSKVYSKIVAPLEFKNHLRARAARNCQAG
jgi:hypothetical protein